MAERDSENCTDNSAESRRSDPQDSGRAGSEHQSMQPPLPADDKFGRNARSPLRIPWRGWLDIGRRVAKNVSDHNISLVAAGVALFSLLAIFPALNVTVSLYALFSSPEEIVAQVQPLERLLPEQAYELFIQQLTGLAGAEGMNFALLFSLVLGIWVAHKGAKALIVACNIVYGEQEKRPFWGLLLVSFAFTLVGIFGAIALTLLVVLVPIILSVLPLGGALETLINLLRWPILASVFIVALQCVYRFAPNRKNARWRWVSPGAILAAVLWIGASVAFTLYVQNFGNYNETYGTIGSVIILILWFYISAFVVLLGAEVNAEMEHQTQRDSTVGEDRPMGERGAYVADTTGDEPRDRSTGH